MCKAHVRAHTTEGRFQCTVCGYRFRHKHHLQRHEVKVHGSLFTKASNQSDTGTNERQVILHESQLPETVDLIIETTAVPKGEDTAVIAHTVESVTQHYVVTTSSDGAPVEFESVDVSSDVYQTLLQQQQQELNAQNTRPVETVLLTEAQGNNAE